MWAEDRGIAQYTRDISPYKQGNPPHSCYDGQEWEMVEAGGIEPPSANPTQKALHA